MASTSFRLDGLEPTDPRWTSATTTMRARYWRRAGEIAVRIKRDELARGLDRHGRKMRPVLPKSRPDGADGAPLSPHGTDSRTRKWLRATVGAAWLTLYWSHGWAKIIGINAEGGPRLPIRDVVGLSPAGARKVRAEAAQFWATISRPRSARPASSAR